MKFLGLILCVLSLFLVYKKLSLIIFGECTKGIIAGYGKVIGRRGIFAYPYLVRFKYNNHFYVATSLESDLGGYSGTFFNQHHHQEGTIFFKADNLEVVTIKEFKGTYIIALCMFLLGVAGVFI